MYIALPVLFIQGRDQIVVEDTRNHLEQFEHTIAGIFSLSVACPHGEELAECPIKYIRKESLGDRIGLVKSMTQNQIESFVTYHTECSFSREGS